MADKHTLIRRATFDLTGLPPTPGEVAAFEADNHPRLSPGWWTVAGLGRATASAGAGIGSTWPDMRTPKVTFRGGSPLSLCYTYRDYVIRAFNEDLPYDQFIKQQIAADLLPGNADKRSLAALGI